MEFPVIDQEVQKPVAAAAALVVQQSTQLDLTKLDLTDVALAQFGDWRADIAAAEKRHKGIVWDLSTAKGMKDIKSFRQRECADPQADANKVGDALVSKLTQVSKKVRSEQAEKVAAYKKLAAPLTKLIDDRQAEIDAEEIRLAEEAKAKRLAEEARLQGLRDAVDGIMAKWLDRCNAEGMTAERISNGIVAFAQLAMPAEVADVAGYWSGSHVETLASMNALKHQAAAREEAARIEAQRIENERIAAELAEKQRLIDEQAAELARQQQEIEAARQRADAPAATATAAATEGKADNPEPGTLEAAPSQWSGGGEIADPQQPKYARVDDLGKTVCPVATALVPPAVPVGSHMPDAPEVASGPLHPYDPNAQEGSSPADAPACASSEAESAEALPSGDEGTGAHADDSAPGPGMGTLAAVLFPPYNKPFERMAPTPAPECAAAGPRAGSSVESTDAPAATNADDSPMVFDSATEPRPATSQHRVILVLDDPKDEDEGGIDAQLVGDTLAHLRDFMTAFDGKFPTQPKMAPEWWQRQRSGAEVLLRRFAALVGEGA